MKETILILVGVLLEYIFNKILELSLDNGFEKIKRNIYYKNVLVQIFFILIIIAFIFNKTIILNTISSFDYVGILDVFYNNPIATCFIIALAVNTIINYVKGKKETKSNKSISNGKKKQSKKKKKKKKRK